MASKDEVRNHSTNSYRLLYPTVVDLMSKRLHHDENFHL